MYPNGLQIAYSLTFDGSIRNPYLNLDNVAKEAETLTPPESGFEVVAYAVHQPTTTLKSVIVMSIMLDVFSTKRSIVSPVTRVTWA